MPVVTAIETQRRQEGRVSVFVDGEFYAGMPAERATALGLSAGENVSAAKLSKIRDAGEMEQAYTRALRFLKTRLRSRAEVRARLWRYGYDGNAVDAVLTALVEKKLLDDAVFAAAYVRDRCAFRPRGKTVVRAELRRLGVSDADAAAALADNYILGEEELARRALGARFERMRAGGPVKARAAIYGFLARRGFSCGVARRLADELYAAPRPE